MHEGKSPNQWQLKQRVNNLMKLILIVIIFVGCTPFALSQQFGGNPASIKWRQINTDTVRIIYPKGLDTLAKNVAQNVQDIAARNVLPLSNNVDKISIVLQNKPATSNGYVGLGPFRSEFYTTPSSDNFDLGSQYWTTQLALHEYRHVQQYNSFGNGLSKIAKRLFGQDGYALAVDAAIPNWFFEGDAVLQETSLSKQGRGRIPAFLMAYPALWQDGKNYSWMKLRNGSFKDYTPDHYALGYLMVNYGIDKYGTSFWKKVTSDASAYKCFFYPWQRAIQKYADVSYKNFTKAAFDYYRNIYDIHKKNDDDLLQKNNVFPADNRIVTNRYYPVEVGKDSLLYLKSSYNLRPAFYLKLKDKEYFLKYRDISIDQQFSYRNGKIVYAAYETNPRWKWESYSVIKILDIKTLQQRTLSQKTKYYSPDISIDGETIALNSVKDDGSSSLIILYSNDGKVKNEIRYDSVTYFANPKFVTDSTIATVLRYKNTKTALAIINVNSKEVHTLLPPSYTLLGQLNVREDTIYFSASQGLKDELFCFDTKTQTLFKLKTEGVGSYFPSGGEGSINWSSFTANGYILKQRKDPRWQIMSKQDFSNVEEGILSPSVSKNETEIKYIQRADSSTVYPQLHRPINFYTWRPNYTHPEFSFTLYGNNVLNTIQTQLYYIYNENNKTHTTGGNITYSGLFPYIMLGSEYVFNNTIHTSTKTKQWNEWDSYVGLSIPLTWTSNRTIKYFNISSTYYYRQDYNYGLYKDSFPIINLSYLAHRISWGQQIATTVQDIYPKFGYNSSFQLRHTIDHYKSWQELATANLFLPGFLKTHSIVLSGMAQYSGSSMRIFSNRLSYARGYGAIDSAGAYTTSVNYHFPIAYPDWGFANIFYLHRVRGNIFYDYTKTFNKHAGNTLQMNSMGAEIYFDTQWWNQHPLTFGFRLGKVLNPYKDNQSLFFEVMLPTNIIPR